MLGESPVSTTVDWYSLVPETTVNAEPVMLLGVPAEGKELGRLAGTGVTCAVQLPVGPHCREPGEVTLDTLVAQFTSAEVWVRSVT